MLSVRRAGLEQFYQIIMDLQHVIAGACREIPHVSLNFLKYVLVVFRQGLYPCHLFLILALALNYFFDIEIIIEKLRHLIAPPLIG